MKPVEVAAAPEAAELRRISAEIAAEFVLVGAETAQVVLLELNPEQVHVYWQIPPGLLPPAATLVLRLHDLDYMDLSGLNPHACIELDLDRPDGFCTVSVPGGDKTLQAEVGLRGSQRRLHTLARSANVRLPPLGPVLPFQAGAEWSDHSPARSPRPLYRRFPLTAYNSHRSPRPADYGPAAPSPALFQHPSGTGLCGSL